MIQDPHIALICLDSVRKDYYDKYAERLTELSTYRFHEMRAPSSWSVPSHAAMFTGKFPSESGIHTYNRDFTTLDSTWLTELEEYDKIAISANTFASAAFGFDELFDKTIPISPSSRNPEGIDINDFVRNSDSEGIIEFLRATVSHDHPIKSIENAIKFKLYEETQGRSIKQPFDFGGKSISQRIQEELETATGPSFVFANFMDAHSPHTPFRGPDKTANEVPTSFTSLDIDYEEINNSAKLGEYKTEVEYIRQTYRDSISYLDEIVSDLVVNIRRATNRDVIFIITSDHGENLGYSSDDYEIGHENSLSEGLLHIPFDIIAHDIKGEDSTINSLLDLGAIISGIRSEKTTQDISREFIPAEVAGPTGDSKGPFGKKDPQAMRAVYFNDQKLIWDSDHDYKLFDISGGPNKQRLIKNEEVDIDRFDSKFAVPMEEFAEQAKESNESVEIDSATKDRLERLGYR